MVNPADILQIARQLRQSGMQAIELRDAETRLRIVARNGGLDAATGTAASASDGEAAAMDAIVRANALGVVRLRHPSQAGAGLMAGARLQAGESAIFLESRGVIKAVDAPIDGEVTQLFVADGDRADYGMPLFAMRTQP